MYYICISNRKQGKWNEKLGSGHCRVLRGNFDGLVVAVGNGRGITGRCLGKHEP